MLWWTIAHLIKSSGKNAHPGSDRWREGEKANGRIHLIIYAGDHGGARRARQEDNDKDESERSHRHPAPKRKK